MKRLVNPPAEDRIGEISDEAGDPLFRDRADLVCHDNGIQRLSRGVLWQRDFRGIHAARRRCERKNGEHRHRLIEGFITHDEARAACALFGADDWIEIDVDDRPLVTLDHRRNSAVSASADENASWIS